MKKIQGKKLRHLTYAQKLQLETYLKAKLHKQRIAELLNCSLSTIYFEINRGNLNGKYSADYSNQKSLLSNKNKGTSCKFLIDLNLADYISKLILEDHLSIIQIRKKCKEKNIDCPSRTTIYRAIDEKLIPNVTRESLKPTTTTIFSNGLIQIPKHIRNKLNLNDKDTVNIILDGEKIIISRHKTI